MGKSSGLLYASRRRLALALGLPAALAGVLFARTLLNGFLYDDSWKIRQLSGRVPSLGQMLVDGRGITHLVHWLDQYLWGDWAPGFHLTNVLLHAIATSLVAWACYALTRSHRASLVTGLLFAIHPVHVEAVASFANRKDLLAMIFVALAIVAWRPGRSPRIRYTIALACCMMALLSKEVAAVGLPGMLLLADLLPLPRNPSAGRERLRRAFLRSLPSFAASLAATFLFAGNLSTFFTRASILQRTELRLSSYDQVLANLAVSWIEVLRLLFFPLRLSYDYPLQPNLELTSSQVILGTAFALLWIIATILLLRRMPIFGFALAWVPVMFVPTSNLVPLVPFLIAERYLYVPSFGVCLLFGLAVDRGVAVAQRRHVSWSKSVVVSLSALILASGIARSFWRAGDWRDERTLQISARSAGFNSWRIELGMGNVLWQEGHPQEAIAYFQRALDSGPLPMPVRRTLVANLWSCGGTREVIRECQRILRDDPGEWECRLLLGEAARRENNHREAIRQYRAILAHDAENFAALRELAFVSATSRDPQLRDLPLALDLATRALRSSHGADPEVFNVLAVINGELGDLRSATDWARKGYHLANQQGKLKEARRIQRTLRWFAYRAHRHGNRWMWP